MSHADYAKTRANPEGGLDLRTLRTPFGKRRFEPRGDDLMLARDGDVTGNRIGPARSSCAIHVGSYNGNRDSIYVQQQTISAEGLSGLAFSTNVPHTVRGAPPCKHGKPLHGGTYQK